MPDIVIVLFLFSLFCLKFYCLTKGGFPALLFYMNFLKHTTSLLGESERENFVWMFVLQTNLGQSVDLFFIVYFCAYVCILLCPFY